MAYKRKMMECYLERLSESKKNFVRNWTMELKFSQSNI